MTTSPSAQQRLFLLISMSVIFWAVGLVWLSAPEGLQIVKQSSYALAKGALQQDDEVAPAPDDYDGSSDSEEEEDEGGYNPADTILTADDSTESGALKFSGFLKTIPYYEKLDSNLVLPEIGIRAHELDSSDVFLPYPHARALYKQLYELAPTDSVIGAVVSTSMWEADAVDFWVVFLQRNDDSSPTNTEQWNKADYNDVKNSVRENDRKLIKKMKLEDDNIYNRFDEWNKTPFYWKRENKLEFAMFRRDAKGIRFYEHHWLYPTLKGHLDFVGVCVSDEAMKVLRGKLTSYHAKLVPSAKSPFHISNAHNNDKGNWDLEDYVANQEIPSKAEPIYKAYIKSGIALLIFGNVVLAIMMMLLEGGTVSGLVPRGRQS